MSSKMTTNSKLSTIEPRKQKQIKQITTTGTESQKWRSHGRLSRGRRRRENWGKVTGNKKHKWTKNQNRQGWVKSSIGNEEAKELICIIHGHELRVGMLEGMEVPGGGG